METSEGQSMVQPVYNTGGDPGIVVRGVGSPHFQSYSFDTKCLPLNAVVNSQLYR